MRFLDRLKAKLEPATTESAGGVDAKAQPSGAPAQAAAVPVDHQATSTEPAEPHIDDHKPNPKVAVAVAGAAVSASLSDMPCAAFPCARRRSES